MNLSKCWHWCVTKNDFAIWIQHENDRILHCACEGGSIEVVDYLVKHGAHAQFDMQDKVSDESQ